MPNDQVPVQGNAAGRAAGSGSPSPVEGTGGVGPLGSAGAVSAVGARGSIALNPSACTSCMLCARECPDWCIHIDSHAETEVVADAGPGARPRTVHVLDRFAIDFGLCLYCGVCIDVCPFDALAWVPVPTVPAVGATGLVHERDVLAAAWASVPTAESEPPASSESSGGQG